MACLNPLDLGCVADSAAQGAANSFANLVIEAIGKATVSMATFWMGVPAPTIDAGSGTVGFLVAHTYWLMTAFAVLSVLVGAGKMAWQRRAAPGAELGSSLLRLVIVQGAGAAGISLAVAVAQELAQWIIGEGTKDFAHDLALLLGILPGDVGVLGALLIILVGVFALLASLVQIVLLVVRNGFLVVLAGTWQLSAAATNTSVGRAAFARHTAWLIAFIFYLPAAALVYSAAFQLVDPLKGGDRLTNAVSGFALLIMAIIALPALVKLVAPAVGGMVSGGGGGAGAAAAGAAVPMGAAFSRSGGGGGSPGGSGGGAGGGAGGPKGGPGPAGATPTGGGSSSGGGGSAGGSGGGSGGSPSGSGGSGSTPGFGGPSISGSAASGAAGGAAGGPAGAGAGAVAGAAQAAAAKVKDVVQGAAAQADGGSSGND